MSPIRVLLDNLATTVLALAVGNILKQEKDIVIFEIEREPDAPLPAEFDQYPPDLIVLEVEAQQPVPIRVPQLSKRFPQTPLLTINNRIGQVKLYNPGEIIINVSAELVLAIRDIQARKEGSLNENVGR